MGYIDRVGTIERGYRELSQRDGRRLVCRGEVLLSILSLYANTDAFTLHFPRFSSVVFSSIFTSPESLGRTGWMKSENVRVELFLSDVYCKKPLRSSLSPFFYVYF